MFSKDRIIATIEEAGIIPRSQEDMCIRLNNSNPPYFPENNISLMSQITRMRQKGSHSNMTKTRGYKKNIKFMIKWETRSCINHQLHIKNPLDEDIWIKRGNDLLLHSEDSEFKYLCFILAQMFVRQTQKVPTLNICFTKMFTFQTTL